MPSKNGFRSASPLALAILLALLPSVLAGQTDPFETEDEPSELIENPFAPEDPGYDGDPTPQEDLVSFGLPLLEGTLDPEIAVEVLGAPESLVPLGPSQTATPATCEGWTNPVTPLGIRSSDGHYFTYAQQPVLLVGVSADAGCHLDLEDGNKCRYGTPSGGKVAPPGQNYPQILADARAKGLNKIRLWVTLGRDPNRPSAANDAAKRARNQPFLREGNYYRLDLRNDDYFDRLREVVRFAKMQDLFVEVTFFAPFEGDRPTPWLAADNLAKAIKPGTTTLESVGFTDERWAALLPDPGRSADYRMRDFQKNVIDWTVRWLWCYDNVFWEIANEAEQANLDPILSAQWQQLMIAYVRAAEDTYRATAQNSGRPLKARHPVAVQPFTVKAAEIWKSVPPVGSSCSVASPGNCRPDVVNGHYTQVRTKDSTGFPTTQPNRLDLGSIRLIREYWQQKKVLGMNEDNITPFNGEKGTRTLKTDVQPIPATARDFGLPDPVRAEAWEFLLHGGGAFDHFGYIYDSMNGQKVRTQLGKIRGFLSADVPVFSLVPSPPALTGPPGAGWADVGVYPTDTSWDAQTLSRKHWAAMESPGWRTAASGRKFLLYVHHSTPRCKADLDDFARQPNNQLRCAGTNLAFDAYDGRRRPTTALRYQETLPLHLGTKAGTFTVSWLDATNPSGAPLSTETIVWNPTLSSCSGRTPCVVTSPKYPYDILLKVAQ